MKDFISRLLFNMKSCADKVFSEMNEIMVVITTFLWSALFFTLVIFTRTGRTMTVFVGGLCVLAIWAYMAYRFYNYAIVLSKDRGKHTINLEYESNEPDGSGDEYDAAPDPNPETYQLEFDFLEELEDSDRDGD